MQRLEAADRFFAATGIDIRHGGIRAYYAEGHDYPQMPPFKTFRDAETQLSAMALPRFIEIDGRRYLVALRRAQTTPAAEQPSLFPMHEDHRPAGERDAAERYREPSLFTAIERNR